MSFIVLLEFRIYFILSYSVAVFISTFNYKFGRKLLCIYLNSTLNLAPISRLLTKAVSRFDMYISTHQHRYLYLREIRNNRLLKIPVYLESRSSSDVK